nr:uncharacterized protein LOC105733645 [Aotus nancymaae]
MVSRSRRESPAANGAGAEEDEGRRRPGKVRGSLRESPAANGAGAEGDRGRQKDTRDVEPVAAGESSGKRCVDRRQGTVSRSQRESPGANPCAGRRRPVTVSRLRRESPAAKGRSGRVQWQTVRTVSRSRRESSGKRCGGRRRPGKRQMVPGQKETSDQEPVAAGECSDKRCGGRRRRRTMSRSLRESPAVNGAEGEQIATRVQRQTVPGQKETRDREPVAAGECSGKRCGDRRRPGKVSGSLSENPGANGEGAKGDEGR